MSEDASPENLRKFLESDDPALVRMGISLAKGAGVEITVKDLEHFLKSEDVEAIKMGFTFAEEVGVGDEAIELLCESLAEGNLAAVWVLGKIGDARAVEPLIKVLKEREWPDSQAAAEALGKIGDGRAVEPLIGVLLDDVEEEVLEAAAEALSEIDEPAVVVRLSSMLDEAIGAVRNRGASSRDAEYEPVERTARALGRIGGAGAVKALISATYALYSIATSKEVYLERYDVCAIPVMEALGDAGAVDPLIVALSENGETDYGDVHGSAYEALIGIGRPAVPALVEALSAKDSGTRSGVARALKAIGWEPDTDKLKALYLIALEDWKGCIELGEPAVEVLVEALEISPQTDLWSYFVTIDLRVGAAESLGELGDVRALEPLSKILEMDDDVIIDMEYTVDLFLAAIKALGKIGDARAIEPLVEVLGTVSGEWSWRDTGMTDEGIRPSAAQALGEIGDARAVEPLIKALEDDDCDTVRKTAAEALGKIGEPAVEPLIKALGKGNSAATEALDKLEWKPDTDELRAAYLLAKLDWEGLVGMGERAVEPLTKALSSEHSSIRGAAASALGWIGDEWPVEPLIKALGDGNSSAAEALGKIGDARAVEPLIKALEDVDVRRAAVGALGEIGDARAVEPLIGVLQCVSPRLRKTFSSPMGESAAVALGKIGDAGAVEPLIGLLSYNDWRVRTNAAEALGMIGDVRAVDPLIGVLSDDEDEWVREAAAGALGDIAEANIKGKEKENILRFLESDDPAMIMMGASMLKGILEK
jgi:HEAT repeat protein